MYFPHIVQGPIGRYNKLSPQFFKDHPFDYDRVTKGFQLILWGYFEKMVISDRLQTFTNGALAKWDQITGFPLILQYHCSQFRCIWIGWDVWILPMVCQKYLVLI